MRAVIFAGPSLPPSAQPAVAGVEWRPPARQGDLYRAALERPDVIGLIDGYFDAVPSVWHKEILWALSRGIRVYGAASLGALRAAEMAAFGMIGVGRVFEMYRDGILTDDDEVAVVHAPEALDYRHLSMAMIDVRAMLEGARVAGALSDEEAGRLCLALKVRFYRDRTTSALLEEATPVDRARLSEWLPAWLNRTGGGVKREDARLLVLSIGHGDSVCFADSPSRADFVLTSVWRSFVTGYENPAPL